MPQTQSTDLIVPEVLMEAVQGAFAGMQALNGSGAARVNSGLPMDKRGGSTVKIPYFANLGDFEQILIEGGALTPAKLTMTSQEFPVEHWGKAFETTEWAEIAANYADPYEEAARQIQVGAQRVIDQQLLVAALTTPLVHDVSAAGTPTINYDHVVDAKMQWGDEQEDVVQMGVHSKVFGDLVKLKDGNGKPLVTDPLNADLTRFAGLPLKISDRNARNAGPPVTYDSVLAKRGALACWYRISMGGLQADRDILADVRVAALHIYFACGLYDRVNGGTKVPAIKLRTQ